MGPDQCWLSSVNNAWNHVTIRGQRESDNWLLFQSITLNGVTSTINQYYAPGSAPAGWWGITANYQLDGNYDEAAYSTYLDNFELHILVSSYPLEAHVVSKRCARRFTLRHSAQYEREMRNVGGPSGTSFSSTLCRTCCSITCTACGGMMVIPPTSSLKTK